MKKILVVPDSFKGSLSASDFCKVFSDVLKDNQYYELDLLPVADGGEGTLECLKNAAPCKISNCVVQNSLYEEVEVPVAFFDDGRTALIESALSNGLPLIKGRENPELTSSYGVGQMIAYAFDMGAKKIIITLGGSSTNDCGMGLLAALGASFYDRKGVAFVPTGGTLCNIKDFDLSMMYPRLAGAKFEAMCDVKNPLLGEKGASRIYGPQKGADKEMVERLEKGCEHVANLFRGMRDIDYSLCEGAGAAGGIGFAVLAGLFGKLKSGIDSVLDFCNFDKRMKEADIIVTGEGSFDSQSLMGKALGGIIKRCGNKPVYVFTGRAEKGMKVPENVKVIEISEGQDLEYAITHAKENLFQSVKKIFE